jgi:hypothetical protein
MENYPTAKCNPAIMEEIRDWNGTKVTTFLYSKKYGKLLILICVDLINIYSIHKRIQTDFVINPRWVDSDHGFHVKANIIMMTSMAQEAPLSYFIQMLIRQNGEKEMGKWNSDNWL